MANCNYILTLPGGEKIKLPASFSTLEKDKEISSLFDKYTNANDAKKDNSLEKLIEAISSKVPKQIHSDVIKNIITESEDINSVYDQINKLISDLGNYSNIESAIRNYIFSGKSANKNLAKLKKALSAPRSAKYFQDLGLQGVLGATNLAQERYRIYSKNEENKEFGFPTEITKNLFTVIQAIINRDPDKKNNNLLYGIEGSVAGKGWSSEDIIIYELGNDLSLFEALFKREALKVDIKKLASIVEKINQLMPDKKIDISKLNLEEFFIGKTVDKDLQESQFNVILEAADDPKIETLVDSIINLVSETISPGSRTLSKALKSLFYQASDSYGKNNPFKKLEDLKFVRNEIEIERTYKQQQLSFMEMDSKIRDEYYSKEEIILENLYENAIKKLTLNKDIVKFPVGEFGKYALVTGIFKRGDNIAVYGLFKNSFGVIESIDAVFKPGELVYKKREEPIDPFDPADIITEQKGLLVASKTPINHNLVKKLVRKGDTVNGNLVLGVYPGYLLLEAPDKKRIISYYNKIKSLTSARALEISQLHTTINPAKFVQISGKDNFSEGDYVLFQLNNKKYYKKILFIDKNNVYYLAHDKKGEEAILSSKKSDLENAVGLRDVDGEMDARDILNVRNEIEKITKSTATMSSFTNPKNARTGDYFHFKEGEIDKYGKVLNDNKVLVFDGNLTSRIVTTLEKLPKATFLTNRDISTNYALFTIRANNYAIKFATEPEPLDVEVRYVVPKDTDLSKIVQLTSGYANIGAYVEPQYIKADEIDITDKILELFEKSSDTKIFIKKESSEGKKFERNLESLTWIKYFDQLDSETKKELNILVPGTYFSLYKENNIDKNIYRIISVSDDVVVAHLNKLSSEGKIITTEIELSAKDLLASRINKEDKAPVGSIGRLYIQNGNTKMGAVLKEVNNLSEKDSSTRVATNKAINKLITKLKNRVKGLDISVELVDPKENFTKGQKAKIMTDENGKTSILINNEIGQTEDVLHEFLHLFLTPLRYKYPEIYNTLIRSVVKNESLNVTDAEEEFVKFVSSKMELQTDFLENFDDLESFVQGIQSILIDVDNEFLISDQDNPITLLNTPLMDLFDIDRNDNSNPMYNLGMITTEPMMREWMAKNNIILNCK